MQRTREIIMLFLLGPLLLSCQKSRLPDEGVAPWRDACHQIGATNIDGIKSLASHFADNRHLDLRIGNSMDGRQFTLVLENARARIAVSNAVDPQILQPTVWPRESSSPREVENFDALISAMESQHLVLDRVRCSDLEFNSPTPN